MLGAIEDEGGTLLPDACKPTKYRLKVPDESTGKYVWKDFFTTGCGKETRFVVIYDVQQPVIIPYADAMPTLDELPDGNKRRKFLTHKVRYDSAEPVTDVQVEERIKRGAGFATVCAVDDSIGRWPRFAKLMKEGSY